MLPSGFKTPTEWFYDNSMIINPDKCSYIGVGEDNNDDTLSFNEFSRDKETILKTKIDRMLTFLKLSNTILKHLYMPSKQI